MPEKVSKLSHASSVKSSKIKKASTSIKIPINGATLESLDINKKKYFKAEIDKLSTLRSENNIISKSIYVRKKEQELGHKNILNLSKSREYKLKVNENIQKKTNIVPHLYDESLSLNADILSSTLIETQPDIEYITVNYLKHIKKVYLDQNLGSNGNMSSSFLEKFFNRECLAIENDPLPDTNNENSINKSGVRSNEILNENVKTPKDEVNICNEKAIDIFKNVEELNDSTDSFHIENSDNKVTNFLDFFFEKETTLENLSSNKVIEANEKEKNKPIYDNKSGQENHGLQSVDQKIVYLNQLQLKDENLMTINSTYIRLYEEFNDKRVQFYVLTRQTCNCLLNALDCCLENFYNKMRSAESNFLAGCCQNCQNFPVLTIEKQHLWYDYLSSSKISNKFDFINDALYVNRFLKKNYVQEFLKRRNNCKCIKLSCCIGTIFSFVSQSKKDKIEKFNSFSCCENCENEKQDFKCMPIPSDLLPISTVNNRRQIFRQKTGSSSTSSLEGDEKLKEIKSNGIMQPLLENSKSTVQSIDDFFESMHLSSISIANRFINKSISSKVKLVENKSYPRIKSVIKDKSNVKTIERNKTKTVRFHDAKHGFYPIEIQEWQDNLREPIYSFEHSLSNPEWKIDQSKNDYEKTKYRHSSLTSL